MDSHTLNHPSWFYGEPQHRKPVSPPTDPLPPWMYDTSVSTASDSQGSRHPTRNVVPLQEQSTKADMYPPYYFPSQSQGKSNGSKKKGPKKKSSSSHYQGGIRSAMSEPGVSSAFDYEDYYRSRRESKSQQNQNQQLRNFSTSSNSSLSGFSLERAASDVGGLSVSEQIRLYNRQKQGKSRSPQSLRTSNSYDDHALQESHLKRFQEDFAATQNSRSRTPRHPVGSQSPASTGRASLSTPRGRQSSGDSVEPRSASSHNDDSSSFPSCEPSPSFGISTDSPLEETLRRAASRSRTKTEEVSTSFGSSIETPSLTTVKQLKKQLWDDHEILHSSRSNTPSRRSQSRPASPTEQQDSIKDISMESDTNSRSSQKFNSKYFQAALAAQERGRSRTQSPRDRDHREDRPRSSSLKGSRRERVEALIRKAGSYESADLIAASRKRESSLDRLSMKARPSRSSPPLPPQDSNRPPPSSFDPQDRYGREVPIVQSLERRRSNSPVVLQRVGYAQRGEEEVQVDYERQQRPMSRSKGTNDRSSNEEKKESPSPVPQQQYRQAVPEAEDSFERLAREFSGDVRHLQQASPPAVSTTRSFESKGNQRDLFVDSRTQITKSSDVVNTSTESNLPSWYKPIMPNPPTPTRSETELTVNRSMDHISTAAFWQEMTNKNSSSHALTTTSGRALPASHHSRPNPNGNMSANSSPRPSISEASRRQEASHQNSLPSSVGDGQSVANLLAKLSAVNRDNPTVALAQIDSILRQESQSNGGEVLNKIAAITDSMEVRAGSPTPFDETPNLQESDDETSVSSITNPTFQGNLTKQQKQQIQEILAAPSLLGPELGHDDRVPSPFGPSTSSFRPPRPSGLQNYNGYAHTQSYQKQAPTQTTRSTAEVVESSTRSKAQEKRELLKMFPPPTTIDVKDRSMSSSPCRQRPSEPTMKTVGSSALEPPGERSFDIDNSILVEEPPKKLDKFIANKQDLAVKIQIWDDMSHGLTKSQTSGEGVAMPSNDNAIMPHVGVSPKLPTPTTQQGQRMHPWDGDVPPRMEKVKLRDTSMEDEVGIETSVTLRPDSVQDEKVHSRSPSSLPDAESGAPSPEKPSKYFASVPAARAFSEDFDTGNSTFFAPSTHGMGWEVTPRMTPEQEKQTQQLSNEYDSAWMAVSSMEEHSSAPEPEQGVIRPDPPSLKAAPRIPPPPPRARSLPRSRNPERSQGPVDLDEEFDSVAAPEQAAAQFLPSYERSKLVESDTEEKGAIEVSLLPGEDMKYLDDPPDSSEVPSVNSENTKERKPRKGGFLRTLMRRDRKRQNTSATSETITSGSLGSHSGGASASRSQLHPVRPAPQIRLMPPPPGVVVHEMPPPRGRGRNQNRGQRSRSASFERFRSSRMAQKFGRVLRLYDHD